jgi:glycosyltransferase involved in cell wall biosynthesis
MESSYNGKKTTTITASRRARRRGRPLRVYMLDLLSIIPYYTGHLCAGLAETDGVDVALGSITYQHDPKCFRRQGVRTDPLLFDFTSRWTALPAFLRRMAKTAESLVNLAALAIRFVFAKPDIVHAQFLPLVAYGLPFEMWFLRVVRAFGIRIVYTVHNVLPQDTGNRYIERYRRLYRLCDRLICHDVAAAERLAGELGVAPERIAVIPHGPLFAEASGGCGRESRSRLGLEPDKCVVLWQGILRPYKGVSFLLQAWREVVNRGFDAKLVIVGTGDPELVRGVEQQVAELGLGESVRTEMRFVSVEELADFYCAADILVYPYSEITTSGAVMTGIGYGKAIIATSLPAFTRMLTDGEDALLVEYGDVHALATGIGRLIAGPALRRRLGTSLAARRAGTPDWAQIGQHTFACYEAALVARPAEESASPALTVNQWF